MYALVVSCIKWRYSLIIYVSWKPLRSMLNMDRESTVNCSMSKEVMLEWKMIS